MLIASVELITTIALVSLGRTDALAVTLCVATVDEFGNSVEATCSGGGGCFSLSRCTGCTGCHCWSH